jgi:hypothetical protein
MYSEVEMKKILGKARWAKIEEYDWDGETIDVMFLFPWKNRLYDQTIWVCQPYEMEMTKKDVVEDLKYFIDCMEKVDEKDW